MLTKIRLTNFEEVFPLWRDRLWPGRISPIRPISPMSHELVYSAEIESSEPTFWILEGGGEIYGCISGYRTGASHYRVRGLYVEGRFRGRGFARRLLLAATSQGMAEGCGVIWSLPRKTAWPAYQQFGFEREGDWFSKGMEFGPNCVAFLRPAP